VWLHVPEPAMHCTFVRPIAIGSAKVPATFVSCVTHEAATLIYISLPLRSALCCKHLISCAFVGLKAVKMDSQAMPPSAFALAPVTPSMPVQPRSALTSKATPTSNDWERHRPLIKRLYLDEHKKLKEVAAILAQHGHYAT
jgi:hypothetical protein